MGPLPYMRSVVDRNILGITEPIARAQPTQDNTNMERTPLLLLVGFERMLSVTEWQRQCSSVFLFSILTPGDHPFQYFVLTFF
jgi:hypothetical protein